LGPSNNYNVYRGCTHGCIYCDSRSKCYQITGVFEDIIVKENAAVLAETELAKKRHKILACSGSMCDPYMPIEKELRLSRKVLEVIQKYGHGAGFLTKNVLALRDLDILMEINKKAKAVACFTLTTMDENHRTPSQSSFGTLEGFSGIRPPWNHDRGMDDSAAALYYGNGRKHSFHRFRLFPSPGQIHRFFRDRDDDAGRITRVFLSST
jgi:hypothetical protein